MNNYTTITRIKVSFGDVMRYKNQRRTIVVPDLASVMYQNATREDLIRLRQTSLGRFVNLSMIRASSL